MTMRHIERLHLEALAKKAQQAKEAQKEEQIEEEDYQIKINVARANITAINNTLGTLSTLVTAMFKVWKETGVPMKHQLDQINAIIDLINLNMDTTNTTSTEMVRNMR